ncbi:MAG: hypothetical protein HUJ51_05000 [Eggerthellaceae bacterium]|nr:hypothetical protein [Eggerthellaceae bacterium]
MDYLPPEYTQGNNLFTLIEQIDRITKYGDIKKQGAKCNRTGSGKLVQGAMRQLMKSRKKLSFYLVDIYGHSSQYMD